MRGSYDEAVDVLYLFWGEPRDVEGEGLSDGVELDFDVENGFPCGVTVLGFERNGWPSRIHDLAEIVSAHSSVMENEVEQTLREIWTASE